MSAKCSWDQPRASLSSRTLFPNVCGSVGMSPNCERAVYIRLPQEAGQVMTCGDITGYKSHLVEVSDVDIKLFRLFAPVNRLRKKKKGSNAETPKQTA